MKRTLLWFLWAFLLSGQAMAQVTLWADKVIEFSSEMEDPNYRGQYKAKEILGKPSILAQLGQPCPAAWNASKGESDTEEYIKVGFERAIKPKQVAIFESFNAGAIVKVELFDEKGEAHVIYQPDSAKAVMGGGRVLNLFPTGINQACNAVRVTLNTLAVKGFNQIDAIAISERSDSIRAEINLAKGIDFNGKRENLGPNINTVYEELLPVIRPDGKVLYFTSQDNPNNVGSPAAQDIWFAEINPDNTFLPAKNIGPPLNNAENNAATSITPDGNTMLLLNKYLPDGKMDVGISIAKRDGGTWGMPVGLEIKNYYNRNRYGEYSLSASGKIIVMTIERDDSEGGKDIYVSFKNEDDTWTEPRHCGPVINTACSETSPFLAPDDKTIYFATDGLPGYGKKDMFVTRRLDESWTNWSEPENLGPVLNSPGWDAYYSIPASGEFAYFVSYEGSIGQADIFRAPLPKALRPKPVVLVKGKVYNAKTNEPLGAEIIYEALNIGKELGIAHSDLRDGSYSIVLPAGEEYGFLAQAKGFFPTSEYIDIQKLDEYQEITRDLRLTPVEAGSVVRLNNLFFDSGKWDLRPQSIQELERLRKMLDENPTMAIEIAGHTDDVGSDASNLELSKKRAASVVKYLTDKGIIGARLKTAGYGESKPQVSNDSPENRQINRRVEFTILQI